MNDTRTRATKALELPSGRLIYFFAFWGLAVFFISTPIVSMVLDQPRAIYLGAWDWRTFGILVATAFVIAPIALGLVGLGLRLASRILATVVFCGLAAYLMTNQIHGTYHLNASLFSEHFLIPVGLAENGLHFLADHFWIVALALGVLLLPIARWLLWPAAVLSAASIPLLLYFAVSIQALTHTATSPLQSKYGATLAPTPVFLVTFEKLLWTYIANNAAIDAEAFPNLAAFVGNSDLYTDFHATSSSTVYALRTLYSGTKSGDPIDEGPNIANIFDATHRVYVFNDLPIGACDPQRHACVKTMGEPNDSRRLNLIIGIWKTWVKTTIDETLAAYLVTPGWAFEPTTDMWAYELEEANLESDAAPNEAQEELIFKGISDRQILFLKRAIDESSETPSLYVVHNFASDGVARCPDVAKFMCFSRIHADEVHFQQAIERQRKRLRNFDNALGDFLDYLREANLYDKSLIIITADTGYSPDLKEFSGLSTFPATDEMTHVFFAMKKPGQTAPRSFDTLYNHVDVLPTLVQYLGGDVSKFNFDGVPMALGAPHKGPLTLLHYSPAGKFLMYERQDQAWQAKEQP